MIALDRLTAPGAAGLALLLVASGCGPVDLPSVAIPGSGSNDMRRLVEDRVWVSTDEAAAPGTLRAPRRLISPPRMLRSLRAPA